MSDKNNKDFWYILIGGLKLAPLPRISDDIALVTPVKMRCIRTGAPKAVN